MREKDVSQTFVNRPSHSLKVREQAPNDEASWKKPFYKNGKKPDRKK